MQVVILCGGKGSRMGSLCERVPKCMVPVAGKPIIRRQVELARSYGYDSIIAVTGHLGEVVESYFEGNGVRCIREQASLGTAGALKQIEHVLDRDFFVFYGDLVMDVDLSRMNGYFWKLWPSPIVVAVHENDHPHDSDMVAIDYRKRITGFACPHGTLANSGLYILNRDILRFVPEGVKADIAKDTLPAALAAGTFMVGYQPKGYIKDAGTPERLKEVEAAILAGLVTGGGRT